MKKELESFSEGSEIDMTQVLRERIENNFSWTVVEDFPENMLLGANIRERSDALIYELAKSIARRGQLQECTGDTLADGQHRVIAGQHRFWAVQKINKWVDEYNNSNPEIPLEHRKLRVRVSSQEFTPYEILDLQITENLHKDMKPEEEADAISELYELYSRVVDEKKASVADFSRRIGRGETKVRNAIGFMELDEGVRELVKRGALLYSVATLLHRVPEDKQFNTGLRVVLYNLDSHKAQTFIKGILQEDLSSSLFLEQMQADLKELNHRLAFRNAADRAAKDASGYFTRLLAVMDMLKDPERVRLTDTIRDILANFITSAKKFDRELGEKNPALQNVLDERVNQLMSGHDVKVK